MACLGRPYYFNFLKAVFYKFYLVHSWIPRPIYTSYVLKSLPFLQLAELNELFATICKHCIFFVAFLAFNFL